MKITAFIIILILCISAMLLADVIRLQNGDVYLGRITGTDSEGIDIESFGRKIKVPQQDLLRTEKDLTSIKSKPSEIILMDGSTLRGKIENYDEEVGVLVNIDFGSLTLPVKSIKEINDPFQKKFYSGNPVQIGIGGGYYMPSGKLKDTFNPGYNYSLFAEFNSNLMRGLFIGCDLTYFPLDYKENSNVNYSIFTLQPYLMYRFLFLRKGTSFLRNFVPFVSAGFGAGYVLLKDKRSDAAAPERSEIDLAYFAKLGCDYSVTNNIAIRLFAGWQTVTQKSDSLNMILINGGVLYSF